MLVQGENNALKIDREDGNGVVAHLARECWFEFQDFDESGKETVTIYSYAEGKRFVCGVCKTDELKSAATPTYVANPASTIAADRALIITYLSNIMG